ncbi:sigma 54-interacting transcriptional regulator [Arhodomonas sp. SL1]|uniref:sigma 54-interacting transcriptional regulator n=1 Tax=Arhodomonas sp. SL1 TaxID=3425691 RepID=UPI003F8857E4
MTNTYRILVVDDDPGVLRLLSIRLRSRGYEVATAASGEEALSNVTAIRPHLVITDLRMDGMDGMALFQRLHEQQPSLPVIILTAHGTIPEAVRATKSGVFSFITKPFEAPYLLQQVDSALRLSGVIPPDPGEEADSQAWRSEIVTRSPAMEEILEKARLVAPSDASVLIQGDSGTGKELLARAIHHASGRRSGPFIAINCGAIPQEHLETELFGTSGDDTNRGLFREAEGGTLFFDEIGDMPAALQVRLLRVLQEQRIRPVGAGEPVDVDVRIISATRRDLEAAMERGDFREDLYYRLNVVSLQLPPLAERREDIALLANHFLRGLAGKYGKDLRGFADDTLERLISAPWPGNVRQLYNTIEQVAILSTASIIPDELVRKALHDETPGLPAFADARRDFERDYLVKLLQITQGNVTQAARLARRNRTEFYKLLNRHELNPGMFKAGR